MEYATIKIRKEIRDRLKDYAKKNGRVFQWLVEKAILDLLEVLTSEESV